METLQNCWTFQHLMGGTAKTALGYENGKDEIRNTSDNIIFLFTPL